MQFLAPVLLLLAALNLVGAASFLQNITVDDTSEDVVYSGSKFQCNTDNSCGIAPALQGSFNHSATMQIPHAWRRWIFRRSILRGDRRPRLRHRTA
ncbi:hypothetical protein FB45DRAFT_920382 [Roridomyces roridus]|uniref:Uncharacterized protein n=1 Tax=Roridomyces roridus TaxID=1738132 RepID=A0AAD7BPE1_9AGAR|nr:hypothetical protein FB45DRAFT_920382 [Roridomyces roridus]